MNPMATTGGIATAASGTADLTAALDHLSKVLSQSDYQLTKVSTRLKDTYDYLYASSATHTNPHDLLLRMRAIQAQLADLRRESIAVHQQRLDIVDFCRTDLRTVGHFVHQIHAAMPNVINEPCDERLMFSNNGIGDHDQGIGGNVDGNLYGHHFHQNYNGNNHASDNSVAQGRLTDQLVSAEQKLDGVIDRITDDQTNELFVRTLLASYHLSDAEAKALSKTSATHVHAQAFDNANGLRSVSSADGHGDRHAHDDGMNDGDGGDSPDISTHHGRDTGSRGAAAKTKPGQRPGQPKTKQRPDERRRPTATSGTAAAKTRKLPPRDLSSTKRTEGLNSAASTSTAAAAAVEAKEFEPISKAVFNRLPRNLKIHAGKLADVNELYERVHKVLCEQGKGISGKKLMGLAGLDSMQKLDVLRGLSVVRAKDDLWTLA